MYEVCFIMLKSDQRRQQADKIHILHRYFLWLKHYSSVEKKGEAHKTWRKLRVHWKVTRLARAPLRLCKQQTVPKENESIWSSWFRQLQWCRLHDSSAMLGWDFCDKVTCESHVVLFTHAAMSKPYKLLGLSN